MVRRAAAFASLIAPLLAAADASAYHTPERRITDGTAYTLAAGTLDLGPFKQQSGILDRLTLGTSLAPWLIGVSNADLKLRFYGGDPLSLSIRLGFTRFSPDKSSSGASAEFNVAPSELLGSYRISDRFTLSGGGLYTVVSVEGSYDTAQLHGFAAVSNLQLLASFEYRYTRVTAFLLSARYLAFQKAGGRLSTRYSPDAYTTIELESAANTDALQIPHAFSIVPSVAFSWKTFNLRLGLGYGNWSVPVVNLVLREKSVVPDFDLHWVF